MSNSVLLSVKAAGEFLGISPWTVRSLIWANQLDVVTLGRKYMVSRADLLAWIEANKSTLDSEATTETVKRVPVKPKRIKELGA
jgi:excisionase family DNA binding protein